MIRILCPALFVLLTSGVDAALPGDTAAGKRVHDANCTGCHGTEVYSRPDRLVRSLPALKEQLKGCIHMAQKNLSPAAAQNIIKYLSDQYYHFERAAGSQERTRTQNDTARKIQSGLERDRIYAARVGRAAQVQDFDRAIDTANSLSSAAQRDRTYADIVHQAILARDFPAADKAARKMSSAALRDEQLRKIVGACPPNTATK